MIKPTNENETRTNSGARARARVERTRSELRAGFAEINVAF